jgi:hypothetical protein
MKKILITLLLLFSTQSIYAESFLLGDEKLGKSLHGKVCVACHNSSVYTRPDRKIKSIGGLRGRVDGCGSQLNLGLKKNQINDLVKYLNDTYYKFK